MWVSGRRSGVQIVTSGSMGCCKRSRPRDGQSCMSGILRSLEARGNSFRSMSPVLALLVIVTEFLGPLGLAVGLLTRVVTVGLLCEMLVAIVRVHWPHGFFRHWTGTQPGKGFAYHLPVIGIALTALIVGAGA
jgi:uncharacterized membrane protein YphA (DoxX/SURF4 family)